MASNNKAAQPSDSPKQHNAATGEEAPLRDSEGRLLGLPEPPSEEEATKLDMSSGGDSVKLDHLGPMVVNKDGTLSRIGNWDQMTEQEKKNTLRILGKRNKQRTSALKEAEDSAAGEKDE
ncbi:unnamed protein product [Zymoseptoria tritici ST99CH_3D1]|nr:unnamed protein product [Zymoseptoria tritici ST99CH_3D1]